MVSNSQSVSPAVLFNLNHTGSSQTSHSTSGGISTAQSTTESLEPVTTSGPVYPTESPNLGTSFIY